MDPVDELAVRRERKELEEEVRSLNAETGQSITEATIRTTDTATLAWTAWHLRRAKLMANVPRIIVD